MRPAPPPSRRQTPLTAACSQSHGTFVNGEKLRVHKPTALTPGQRLAFGGLAQHYTVRSAATPEMSDTVRASHLLVKHRDVRRPSSWKEPTVTRSKEDAFAKIQAFHAQLTSGDAGTLQARFAELASQESHCSSAKRGGDLGPFSCASPHSCSPATNQGALTSIHRAGAGRCSGPLRRRRTRLLWVS